MAPPQNLLDVLRERTIVDCDTMDVEGKSLLKLFSYLTLTDSSCPKHWQTRSICRLHLESGTASHTSFTSSEILLIAS
jgi:hypothetical protein